MGELVTALINQFEESWKRNQRYRAETAMEEIHGKTGTAYAYEGILEDHLRLIQAVKEGKHLNKAE